MLAFVQWGRASVSERKPWRLRWWRSAAHAAPVTATAPEESAAAARAAASARAEAERERAYARAVEMIGWMAR